MGNPNTKLSRRGFIVGAATMGLAAGATALAGCSAPQSPSMADTGEFQEVAGTGSAAGKNGMVTVRAAFTGDEMTGLDIVESNETLGVGTAAIDTLRSLILEHQTLNTDVITGATLSSMTFLAATAEAIKNAGRDEGEWKKREAAAPVRDIEIPTSADVVVIGSGGAGLAAAITAAKAEKSVLVLEKLGTVGGNSALSGAGMAAPGNWQQLQLGVEDSTALMAEDMLRGGDNLAVPELVQVVCDGALDAQEWLTHVGGVTWKDMCAKDGGHSVARSLQAEGYGAAVINKMKARAAAAGAIVATNASADELIVEGGKVVGVRASDLLTGEEVSISAKSVVIASGGFGANVEMRSQYVPELTEDYRCTDAVGTTGDGIAMAQAIGAAVTGMEHIQTHPTGSTTTGDMLAMGSIRTRGFAFVVNKQGNRFMNELGRRDEMCEAELQQEGGCGYFVFSRNLAEETGVLDRAKDELGGMTADGSYFEADTIEEVCDHFGVDANNVKKAIEQWNEDAKTGVDTAFGYAGDMKPFGDAPYAMFPICPTVHYTMGGVAINANAEVIDESGRAIPGLFAAGEVAGGIMGSNRLGTTSYTDIIVFGRLAGANAAAVA